MVDDFWNTPVVLEPFPTLPTPAPARTVEATLAALQDDVRYVVSHTAVLVYVEGPQANDIGMLFNTRRGQKVPTGTSNATGGHTFEFRDLGAPQPGAPEMTIAEAVNALYFKLLHLGLEVLL